MEHIYVGLAELIVVSIVSGTVGIIFPTYKQSGVWVTLGLLGLFVLFFGIKGLEMFSDAAMIFLLVGFWRKGEE